MKALQNYLVFEVMKMNEMNIESRSGTINSFTIREPSFFMARRTVFP
jgi:hypothetical protein